MNVSWLSLTLIGGGLLVYFICAIILLVVAFRQHVLWALAVLFLPLGSLIFTCIHWTEARGAFLGKIAGVVMLIVGFVVSPDMTDEIWKDVSAKYNVQAKEKAPDLNAEIQEHRQRIESLQAVFAQDGVELTRLYQTLDAQRKALKPGDVAAITKFNEAAAAYQTRNATRKQMQEQIETTQRELEALLETRSRANAAHTKD